MGSLDTPLVLTCGDPAGIGPELIRAWLRAPSRAGERVVVCGPATWLDQLPLRPEERLPVGAPDYVIEPGRPSEAGAAVAVAALEAAAAGVREGRYCGVVTAPISKEWAERAGFAFPGQTEFFAVRWGGEPTMAFTGGRLRVVLATWHIPLSTVPAALTQRALNRAVSAAAHLCRAEGIEKPRIAVCGLNPHAGEKGLLGSEERDHLDGWLAELRDALPGVSSTLPGDTVFARCLRGEFDVAVALYHDQGLAPLKAVDFDDSVNVTLGLPFVRTSPDHGTAFSLAGKGLANPSSFFQAVRVARRLIKFRSAG